MSEIPQESYEYVNHPKHYNRYSVEVVDMMEKIYGLDAAITWCELTAFKYRMRAGTKPNTPFEKDIEKEIWCLEKCEELKMKKQNKCENNCEIINCEVHYHTTSTNDKN